jgi:hypothetical protein
MGSAANDSVSEFQARRSETWRIIRPWTFVTAAGFLLFAVGFNLANRLDELTMLILIFGCFPVLFLSIGRIALTVSRLYRCPACDGVPKNRGKVLVDPDDCPNCGARLK